jgi:hypothetical protein
MRDERSYRVALVADRYVNPKPGQLDGLAVLAEAGWGVMQLPDDRYPSEIARPLLAEIAEQVEEFSRHGYGFILVGDRDGLAEALALVGARIPGRIVPAGAAELREFLALQPVPPALAAVQNRRGQATTAASRPAAASAAGPVRRIRLLPPPRSAGPARRRWPPRA